MAAVIARAVIALLAMALGGAGASGTASPESSPPREGGAGAGALMHLNEKHLDSMVEYAYFSDLKSKSPALVLRLMAALPVTYGSEKQIVRHFREVMSADLEGIFSAGKEEVARARDGGKEQLQRTLEIGLARSDDYIELFRFFAKMVKGQFFQRLPTAVQRRFSEFFRVSDATKEELEELAPSEGEEMAGRQVVAREETSRVVDKSCKLVFTYRTTGRWKFFLSDKVAVRDDEVYAEADTDEPTKQRYGALALASFTSSSSGFSSADASAEDDEGNLVAPRNDEAPPDTRSTDDVSSVSPLL